MQDRVLRTCSFIKALMPRKRSLTAIDLYSGIGGWSLGLRMAGIRVIASFERWDAANRTNRLNNGHRALESDIRHLKLNAFPKVDVVVGSPPCTQFSYSNRGGNGDIDDGLVDIRKFLAVVRYVRPKFWAMENVPRVAAVLERELKPRGKLAEFRELDFGIHVLNLDEFGIPQRRRRCIAGNFDADLLKAYTHGAAPPTLGTIVGAFRRSVVVDPLYGLRLKRSDLQDHHPEEFLDDEEIRINRAAKAMHVVYNSMPFPDSLDRPARTITATCTRVSRESIIIESKAQSGKMRRLTVRERASLQGFPISFQLFADSHAQKLRMIGNAVPPTFAFHVGHVFQGTTADKLPPISTSYEKVRRHPPNPPVTAPDTVGAKYPASRTFRFAVPSLRLKSGVRFELRNTKRRGVGWEVAFVFGTPQSIHEMPLTKTSFVQLTRGLPLKLRRTIQQQLDALGRSLEKVDGKAMQENWTRRADGGRHPFKILDRLDREGRKLRSLLKGREAVAKKILIAAVAREFGDKATKLAGLPKLGKNSRLVLAGLLVEQAANAAFRAKSK